MKTPLVQRFADYLAAYSAKDMPTIAQMFAAEVRLRDWKISVAGREAALAETRKNFSAARSIAIDILATYESAGAVAGELRIVVDESEVLNVVDVVSFDAQGQIASIRAYLGRAD